LVPVHARGSTPDEALREFDKAFTATEETERLKKLVADELKKAREQQRLQRLHKVADEKRRRSESSTNE
jgi:predicted RNase H-like HicB family nuclease